MAPAANRISQQPTAKEFTPTWGAHLQDTGKEVPPLKGMEELSPVASVSSPHAIAHLAKRIFGCPLLIAPDKFHVIMSVLAPRLGLAPEAAAPTSHPPAGQKPYMVTPDGIAIIPISGTLVHKSYGLDALSGLQSYAELGAQIEDAATDPAVKGILLDCDSPGGELAGAFDLADMIYQARSAKPIYAIADNDSFSAAYLIASCAEKVFATRTSGLGSIGVIMSHVDESGADAKDGLKYTLITAGAHKADMNPHAPLSEEARVQMQSLVDRAYGMLCQTVARNRGVSADAIQKTEAGIYFGTDGIKAGLADQMGTIGDAVESLRARIAGPQPAAPPRLPAPAMPVIPSSIESSERIRAEAVQIAELCALAGLPGEILSLLKKNATIEQVREHLVRTKAAMAAQSDASSYLLPLSNRNAQGEIINPQGAELMLAATERLLEKSRLLTGKK